MENKIMRYLEDAISKYGKAENLLGGKELSENWRKDTFIGKLKSPGIDSKRIVSKVLQLGRILEDNQENPILIQLISTGGLVKHESLVVYAEEDDVLYIAAFSTDYMFANGTPQKAVEAILSALNEHL